jgi:hypothetical protein
VKETPRMHGVKAGWSFLTGIRVRWAITTQTGLSIRSGRG